MEGKSIFIVTKEVSYDDYGVEIIGAYKSEEVAKQKMKEVGESSLKELKGDTAEEDIDVEENERAIYINENYGENYILVEVKQTTPY